MSIFYKKLNKVYRDSFIHVLVDKFNNSFHESIIYKGFIKLTGVKYFGFIFVLVIVFIYSLTTLSEKFLDLAHLQTIGMNFISYL